MSGWHFLRFLLTELSIQCSLIFPTFRLSHLDRSCQKCCLKCDEMGRFSLKAQQVEQALFLKITPVAKYSLPQFFSIIWCNFMLVMKQLFFFFPTLLCQNQSFSNCLLLDVCITVQKINKKICFSLYLQSLVPMVHSQVANKRCWHQSCIVMAE